MSDRFVPDDFEAPQHLDGPGFRLEPLGPEHNDRDYEAWTASIEHIRSTPGDWGSWPYPMSLDENRRDLERHAKEFTDGEAFTYSILDDEEVIGCLYIYPDADGPTDAFISSWVRASRAEQDVVVWTTVSDWLDRDWPFSSYRYHERH